MIDKCRASRREFLPPATLPTWLTNNGVAAAKTLLRPSRIEYIIDEGIGNINNYYLLNYKIYVHIYKPFLHRPGQC